MPKLSGWRKLKFMKQKREYAALSVSKKAENSIESGHPWIYDSEIFGENTAGCADGSARSG